MPIQIAVVALVVLLADQITKALMLKLLAVSGSIPILPGIFHLTLVRNTGVAFGLLNGYGVPVAVLTTAILMGLIWSTMKGGGDAKGIHPALTLGLIVGGAMGNLLDRMRFGSVVDFLDFRVWPVFNLADSCITIGAVLMAWSLIRQRK